MRGLRGQLLAAVLLGTAALTATAHATGCAFDLQGEGRVTRILDGRTLELDDGRTVRLAGIEPVTSPDWQTAIARLIVGQQVTLRGEDDTPDRYGRQRAFVYLAVSGALLQNVLLNQGLALFAADVVDKECALTMLAAEVNGRKAKQGIWADSSAIKNAESSDDIVAGIGHFSLIEGRVLSVRQAGATTYLNFGRNWTRGFAVTISRKLLPTFEAAGMPLKSLENRRVRVRGWVEMRGGPRIEALRVGQIELLGEY